LAPDGAKDSAPPKGLARGLETVNETINHNQR
jgi:hypothetical protein